MVFGPFFPPPFFGALTFSLYGPSWLILALHLLVRQVLTSVPIPSTVPSYFLLVAKIEVTPSKRLFLLTGSGRWQVHLMRRGRIFLDPIVHPAPCFPVGDSLHQDVDLPIEVLECRGQGSPQPFPLTPRPSIIRPWHTTSSARALGPNRVWAGL